MAADVRAIVLSRKCDFKVFLDARVRRDRLSMRLGRDTIFSTPLDRVREDIGADREAGRHEMERARVARGRKVTIVGVVGVERHKKCHGVMSHVIC
eukprot:1364398-Amorphochlora_amoeboformis.AAC.1